VTDYKTVDTPCPECRFPELRLSLVLRAAEIGDFSLAGVQMKFSVSSMPMLECGWYLPGTVDGRTGEALFSREAWRQ
jgi:hypothetical protein